MPLKQHGASGLVVVVHGQNPVGTRSSSTFSKYFGGELDSAPARTPYGETVQTRRTRKINGDLETWVEDGASRSGNLGDGSSGVAPPT